jgi:hypothetical protein
MLGRSIGGGRYVDGVAIDLREDYFLTDKGVASPKGDASLVFNDAPAPL